MTTDAVGNLVKLSDTDQTVATSDEDIRGRTVRDKNGDDIGTIDDLLIDEGENKVRFLEVGSGGILGLGQNKSFIPVDSITGVEDDVHINQTREHVAGAPAYNPELTEQSSFYEDIYSYYGTTPFWSAGYMYPGYPYFR
ncbi:PRC-barrel domain-containing protein [Arthrobacter sp. AET 35A]|uniref:PRC-barrel domain-containing protein n=1 Tax=Arthrobacter sp. AET 35A TaxID=2292643 RepID=UPI00178108B9|nr:PRC-barrel domain-containing protein [Arthrobacter sp. AET 35A]MBE0011072.1 PRC-barrel domain containing protein [Arthrobacter sp. AET 35A]